MNTYKYDTGMVRGSVAHRGDKKQVVMWSDIFVWCLLLGLCASPFSTSRDSAFRVFPLGVPIFIVAGGISLGSISSSRTRFGFGLLISLVLGITFIVYNIVLSFESPRPLPSIWRLLPMATGLLVYAGLAVVRPRSLAEKHFSIVSLGITLSGLLLASYYILNFAYASSRYGFASVLASREVEGLAELPWGASNLVAGILLMPLIHALALTHMSSSRPGGTLRQHLEAAAPFVIFAAIAVTLSRTSGFVAISFLLVHMFIQRRRINSYLYMTVVIVSVLGMTYWAYGQIVDGDVMAVLVSRGDNVSSFNTRSEIWNLYISNFFGSLGRPLGYYSLIDVYGLSGHNWFVTTLVEIGISGVILGFVFLVWVTMFSTSPNGRLDVGSRYRSVIRLGFVFIFFAMQFEDIVYASQFYQYFWTIAGLSCLSKHAFST